MIFVEFECKGSFFQNSLKMVGRKYAEPSGSGFIAAHDTMEHTSQDRGSLENELRALGAAPITRAEALSGHAVGSDIGYVMHRHYSKKRGLRRAPEVSLSPQEFTMFVQMEVIARTELHSHETIEALPQAMAWAKFGYVLAKQRYPNKEIAARAFAALTVLFDHCMSRMKNGWKVRVLVDEVHGTIDSEIVTDDCNEFEMPKGMGAVAQLKAYKMWLREKEMRKYAESTLVTAKIEYATDKFFSKEFSKVFFGSPYKHPVGVIVSSPV